MTRTLRIAIAQMATGAWSARGDSGVPDISAMFRAVDALPDAATGRYFVTVELPPLPRAEVVSVERVG